VFTPNGDNINDLLVPMGSRSSNPKQMLTGLILIYFNRWGKTMYTTTDPEINWDGKNQNNNDECINGVYYYVCDVYIVTLDGEDKITMKGSVTLIR